MEKETKQEELTKEDYKILLDVIRVATERGGLRADELAPVGYIYEKLKKLWQ